jgi:nickel transport protein
MKIIAAVSLSVLATILCEPLCAHELVLLPQGKDDVLIRFGHRGEYEPADLHKIFRLDAYVEGQPEAVSLLDLKPEKADVDWLDRHLTESTGGKAVTMVTGSYDNGYWTSVTKGTNFNTSKILLPNGHESWHTMKIGKGLFPAIGKNFNLVTGQPIEIIPQSDPFKVKPGETLPVKVLFQGKPLEGIDLEIDDGKTKMKEEIPRYKTDADGIAQLPITHGGLQLITTEYEARPLHPDLCDRDAYNASLAFTIDQSK